MPCSLRAQYQKYCPVKQMLFIMDTVSDYDQRLTFDLHIQPYLACEVFSPLGTLIILVN